jgi:hypothetical protein
MDFKSILVKICSNDSINSSALCIGDDERLVEGVKFVSLRLLWLAVAEKLEILKLPCIFTRLLLTRILFLSLPFTE